MTACLGAADIMEGRTAVDRDAALRLCQGCPVLNACRATRDEHLARGETIVGVWAGELVAPTQRVARVRPVLEGRVHGLRSTYKAGCGCDVCREVERLKTAARGPRLRRKESAA